MKKIMLLMMTAVFLFAVEKNDITTVMKNKINDSTKIIVQQNLTPEEKAQKIFPVFDDIFDYKLMTKLSLGKTNWVKMSNEERTEFTQKFVTHLKNSYVEKISLYTDEKLKIIELKEINKKRVWLYTQLIGSKDTYDITYKFYKSKTNGWLIYDVSIIGISLIQIYKAQFNNILLNESYTALLEKIKTK